MHHSHSHNPVAKSHVHGGCLPSRWVPLCTLQIVLHAPFVCNKSVFTEPPPPPHVFLQASLADCSIQNIKEEVVHMLVTVALEESASRRELASILISDLYGSVINSRDVAEGTHTHLSSYTFSCCACMYMYSLDICMYGSD